MSGAERLTELLLAVHEHQAHARACLEAPALPNTAAQALRLAEAELTELAALLLPAIMMVDAEEQDDDPMAAHWATYPVAELPGPRNPGAVAMADALMARVQEERDAGELAWTESL